MEAAPTCVCPVARTIPVPAPLASARSAATPVPRVSVSGAPASVDVPCEGGWKEQGYEFEGLPIVGRSQAPQVAPGEEGRMKPRAPRSELRAEAPGVVAKSSVTTPSQAWSPATRLLYHFTR